MATSLLLNSGAAAVLPGATSTIATYSGDTFAIAFGNDLFPFRLAAGTLSKLFVRIFSNDVTASSTVISRINSVDGNLRISIPAGATGEFYDNANTDSIVNGDSYNLKFTAGTGGSAGVARTVVQTLLTVANRGLVMFGGIHQMGDLVGSRFSMFCGTAQTTTEANAQARIGANCTLRNFGANVVFNNDASSETIVVRINGATGNLGVTIPSATTGYFEDEDSSDAIVENDLVCLQTSRNGSGTLFNVWPTILHAETDNNRFLSSGGDCSVSAATTVTDGATTHISVNGFEQRSTESDVQSRNFIPNFFSKLWIRLATNATTSASTFDLRSNSQSTDLSISIPSGTTGAFSNDSDVAPVYDGEQKNLRIVNGGGGSLIWTAQSLLVQNIIAPLLHTFTMFREFAVDA